MPVPPPELVRAAFGKRGEPLLLPGGRGITYRVGGAVLKPVDNVEEANWIAATLSAVVSDDFRVPRPLAAEDGEYVVNGWTAWEFLDGRTLEGERFGERLSVCRSFQVCLSHLERPAFLSTRSGSWSLADRLVWDGLSWQACPELREVSDRLQALLQPLALPAQVIHGDMTGNVLFAPGQPPVVIDFVPYWRPRDYAAAIFIVDAMLWERAPASLAEAEGLDEEFWQLLVHAALWRLLVLDIQYQWGYVDVRELTQVAQYQRLAVWLESLASLTGNEPN